MNASDELEIRQRESPHRFRDFARAPNTLPVRGHRQPVGRSSSDQRDRAEFWIRRAYALNLLPLIEIDYDKTVERRKALRLRFRF